MSIGNSASGEIFVSHTRLNGRYVLRLAIGNARTTEADVRRAWVALRRALRTLHRQDYLKTNIPG